MGNLLSIIRFVALQSLFDFFEAAIAYELDVTGEINCKISKSLNQSRENR